MPACPSCGTENPADAKFCSECGTRLEAAADGPARETRKTVTVLFSDVTGSTELGERLDPESLRGAMERYFDRMRSVLEAHGGTVEKFIGDAIMAVFGVPTVHEDDAVRAVRAAAEMRETLDALNRDLQEELGISIAVRTGINTGEVVAGARGGDQRLVTGDAVNTAARLEAAAASGEILIGERTYELVRDAVEAEAVDPLALKGKAEVVDAYRLLEVRPLAAGHERRLDAPMIGRERQLRMLVDAFGSAVADGACHLFTVLGPAGIGKSRLVREFVARVEGARVLAGRCLSYGEGITFWPIEELAIQAAGIGEDDPPEAARSALRAALEPDPEAASIASQLADVLGIGGAGPAEPSWAIRRFLESLAKQGPVVAVVDDIHWAEPTLLDVLEHVAEWSRDVPILLLCMARPELLETRPAWGGGKRNATSVHLEPLSEPEADELIETLLGHPALTREIRERIRAAAQGNPLFVEEMLQMLLDDGILVLKDGGWTATVDLTTVHVPGAISALLAARLDRLSAQERRVAEAASVVGEVFEVDAVQALTPTLAGEVADLLGSLLRKDVVRPSSSDVGGREAMRFRHILLRDAAYAAVPKAERAALHEAFADHLGGTLGERAGEFDEFVGYHLEQAHRLLVELGTRDARTDAVARRAFGHLVSAGDRAFDRGDMTAAVNLLGRAAELVDPDAPERWRIGWKLAQAMLESGAMAAATSLLRDVHERATAAGDEVAAGYAECILWLARTLTDPEMDAGAWLAAADRLIERFERIGDAQGAALAWAQRAYALWLTLQVGASGAAAERALAWAREAGDRHLDSDIRGHHLATVGLSPQPFSETDGVLERTLAEARASGDRRLEQAALRGLGMRAAFTGRTQEGLRRIAEGRAILQELGLAIDYHAAAQNMARVALLDGDLETAARVLRESSEELERIGETAFLSTTAAVLATVELHRGDRGSAERWLDVAERTASASDASSQIQIEMCHGLLALADGDPEGADRLRRAVALVDVTDSPLWRSDARLDVAEGLASVAPDDAVAFAREALELSEAKGITAFVDRANALLARLAAGP